MDEINSTLRGQQERGEVAEAETADTSGGGGGFRVGFLLVVVICAILVAVYALAPRLVALVPDAAPALAAYVDWVNMLRGQVNGLVQSGVDWVQGMLG